MDGDARPYSPADARLTAILDSLLLGAVIIDPARHRLRQCRGGRDHLLETFMDISAVKEKDRLQGVLEMAGAAAHHLGQPLQILLTSIE